MSKAYESAKRRRYIRLLERFIHGILTYLNKSETLTKDSFDHKVDTNFRFLDQHETIQLYKEDYALLEQLVQKILEYRHSDTPIDTIKENILYLYNQYDKRLNARNYKKEKHARNAFEDQY